MICSFCDLDTATTRHIDLYVNGSEGLNLCPACELELVQAARDILRRRLRERRDEYLKEKRSNSQ